MQNPDQGKFLLIPVSVGELADKLSILSIKEKNIKEPERLKNILQEKQLLEDVAVKLIDHDNSKISTALKELNKVNEEIWDALDMVHKLDLEKDYGEQFAELTKDVYLKNNERAILKRTIDTLTNSLIKEEKSYKSL